MATLAGKNLSFRPKNGFSDVFKNKCTKLLRNFTSALRDSQTYKIVAHLNLKGAPTIKKATLLGKKSSFERENVKKMGFLRVFTHYCTKSLRNFTVVLRWCSNSQDSRLLIGQGAPVMKWTTLSEEKKVLAKKLQKNGFFGVFTHYCTESLRNFTVVLRWCSNWRDSRLFDWARCASNKMDNFIRRNKKFWAKKLQKMGFLRFSHITVLNRFAILP